MRKALLLVGIFLVPLGATAWAQTCSGHGISPEYPLKAGEKITIEAVEVNGQKLTAGSTPTSVGYISASQSVSFKVRAYDNDNHVCDIGDPVKAYIKPVAEAEGAPAPVRVEVWVDGGAKIADVSMTAPAPKTTNAVWSGAWPIPAGLEGQSLLFKFFGVVDDEPCDAHSSDDVAVDLAAPGAAYVASAVVLGLKIVSAESTYFQDQTSDTEITYQIAGPQGGSALLMREVAYLFSRGRPVALMADEMQPRSVSFNQDIKLRIKAASYDALVLSRSYGTGNWVLRALIQPSSGADHVWFESANKPSLIVWWKRINVVELGIPEWGPLTKKIGDSDTTVGFANRGEADTIGFAAGFDELDYSAALDNGLTQKHKSFIQPQIAHRTFSTTITLRDARIGITRIYVCPGKDATNLIDHSKVVGTLQVDFGEENGCIVRFIAKAGVAKFQAVATTAITALLTLLAPIPPGPAIFISAITGALSQRMGSPIAYSDAGLDCVYRKSTNPGRYNKARILQARAGPEKFGDYWVFGNVTDDKQAAGRPSSNAGTAIVDDMTVGSWFESYWEMVSDSSARVPALYFGHAVGQVEAALPHTNWHSMTWVAGSIR